MMVKKNEEKTKEKKNVDDEKHVSPK